MLGSFDMLRKNPSPAIPRAMLDFFNSETPKGYEYSYTNAEGAICHLLQADPNAGDMEIRGCTPVLTEEQRGMLGELANDPDAVMEYMHDTLQPIQMDITGATVSVGGTSLPATKLSRTVDDDDYAGKGRFELIPVPKELSVPYECNGVDLAVDFKQVPSETWGSSKFESTDTALAIALTIEREPRRIHYAYRFDNTRERSAEACLRAAQVFRGFGSGETTVKGYGTVNPDVVEQGAAQGADLVDFWKKVVDLEGALDVKFDSSRKLNNETITNILRLHECIIGNRAVGLGFKPSSITVDTAFDKEAFHAKVAMVFPLPRKLRVFGEELEVNAVAGIKGAELGEPSKKPGGDYEYPLSFGNDYQCAILYLANGDTDDSEENVAHLREILEAPLPGSRHY